MTFMRNKVITVITVFALTAGSALALTPLPEEKHINNSLMAGFVADTIRKTCPSISGRVFLALAKLQGLKRYALAKGYKEDDVRAFIKDPKEKARVKGMAAAYLKEHGAVPGDVQSYCKVGYDEIAKKSLIGQLLRAR
ncbi:MAG TPA: hypothetical protein ENJ91_12235 [Rhodobacteraceae bacterium]|nr:hypothetical protein [Paracoccaceae bacterium]